MLTAAAWDALRGGPVFTQEENAHTEALRRAGADVRVTTAPVADVLAAGDCVLLTPQGTDTRLVVDLGQQLARGGGELEVVYGSWDPPGARLLDVVRVMDRLASPGGDPWKRAQTHESLAEFLLEEAYEAYDAIGSGDRDALREELGDVLLQVVLHARLAENRPEDEAWSIDDVAGDLVDKLIRRNPHVFGGEPTEDLDEIIAQWERIKKSEKARDSALDGIAWAQPSLALAAKVLSRAERAGLPVELPLGDGLGERLLALVAAAREHGEDAEAALRRAVLALAERVRTAERP